MLEKRGICRFVVEILGSTTLFSAFHKHAKKYFFSHFSVTLRFQTKFCICFFRTADKTCVSGGSTFFRHSDSNTLENSKKVAAQKTGKTALFPLGNRT